MQVIKVQSDEKLLERRRYIIELTGVVLLILFLPIMMASAATMLSTVLLSQLVIINWILTCSWIIISLLIFLIGVFLLPRYKSKAWGKDLMGIHFHLAGPLWTISTYALVVLTVYVILRIVPGAIIIAPELIDGILLVFTSIIIIQIIFCYVVIKGRDYYLRSENRTFPEGWEDMSREIGSRLEEKGLKFKIELAKGGYDRQKGHGMPKHIKLRLSNGIDVIICRGETVIGRTRIDIFPVEEGTYNDTERIKRIINDAANGLTKGPSTVDPPKPAIP